jgi:signal transduction histidine kinase
MTSDQAARRVLVIDDDPLILESLRLHLQQAGFEVLMAAHGMGGVKISKEQLPDVILCDLLLPDVSGYDVLRAVRASEHQLFTPFIMITGDTDPGSHRLGMEMGADDFINKPFEYTDVLVAVHTQLLKHQKLYEFYQGQKDELARAKRLLSVVMAHELRTPMIAITMATDLLAMQWGDMSQEEVGEVLTSLDRGTRRMRHMVEQMVLLTQLETEVLSGPFIQARGVLMSLHSLAQSAAHLARDFHFQTQAPAIQIKPPLGKDKLQCDPSSIKHAIAEIMSNALMFSPAQRPIVVSQWQEGPQIWLSILDEGRGMSAAEQQTALELFQQIDREKHEQQGMGVGLPIAKRILEAHGGGLEIRSVVGQGTQVLIHLPLAKA